MNYSIRTAYFLLFFSLFIRQNKKIEKENLSSHTFYKKTKEKEREKLKWMT